MTDSTLDQAKAATLARFTTPGADHVNCAQALGMFGLLVLGRDTDLITALRYFGGGISGMGGTCGVITGTAFALGLRDYYQGITAGQAIDATHAELKELLRDFEDEFGSCRCRELTGYDLSTPENLDVFHQSEESKRCADYVSWMCDQLFPLLRGEGQA